MIVMASAALAQSVTKHPRVAELERFLSGEAFNYVKGRFPNSPVLVEVTVDPLRRVENGITTSDNTIPFNTTKQIIVVDEWDDPSRSLHQLFPRIRAATVKVILPTRITDKEVLELRESLFSTLKLVYGRDRIEFERRVWKTSQAIDWWDVAMIALVLLMFLPVLYFSLRSAATRVTKGISEMSTSMGNAANAGGGGGGAVATPVAPPTPKSQNPSGDIRFNDPIQIAEKIQPVIEKLAEDKTFPDLEDMLHFDQAVTDNPSQMGALLNVMPKHIQEKLFMMSSHSEWLAAFSEPGELSTSNYEFVSRLQSKDRESENPEWEELLILLWRLDDLLPNFLQEVESKEAMSILAAMPSRISIPMGKRALPGSWAALLDPDFKQEPLDSNRIGKLSTKALEIKPYNDVSMLKKYRHEKGLITFLKTANVRDEQEVYEAAGSKSTIHVLRPPFYRVLNMSVEQMATFIPKFGMEQWALALFNVSRDERVNFEKAINDKQRYFFIENLKALNGQNVSPEQIGDARERIAEVYSRVAIESNVVDVMAEDNAESPAEDKKEQAA